MKRFETYLVWFGIGLFLGIVLLNLYFSQKAFPSLYNKFIWGNKCAVNDYLNIIKKDSDFSLKLLRVKKIFGGEKIDEFVKSQNYINKEIKHLNEGLSMNPNFPDLLYALYILYQQKGEINLANFYLQKTCNLNPLYSKKCM